MFDQRANEEEALRNWKVALEQYERMLAQPNCNYALPHVRRWIKEKQHLQIKIAELEAKRAREDGIPVSNKEAPEGVVESTAASDALKGFDGLGQKQTDLSRYFDTASLTERQRECASMKWEYGLRGAEIARRLGLHHSTVQETLKAVTTRLERDGNFKRALKRRASHRSSHDESN